MSSITSTKILTLEEFLALPCDGVACELIDGQSVAKMSPQFLHSYTQKQLLLLLDSWAENRGRVLPEWAILLKRKRTDWVPVPDLTYISYQRLAADWMEDTPCPIPPELAIEIISPGQSFGKLAEKATDYLTAGVNRVWLVDPKAQTITVFYPDTVPKTFRDDQVITDQLLLNLEIIPKTIFKQKSREKI